MLENLVTLAFLVLLQAVLGFDNLLYIALESKQAPAEKQSYVRKLGIGIAIAARIVLLAVLYSLIAYVEQPLFAFDLGPERVADAPARLSLHFSGEFNLHAIIVLVGGVFIMYTAVKEIWHMLGLEEHAHAADDSPRSVASIITMIVLMNCVFSVDSILSAMALTKELWVMATAIVIGGLLMILLADTVSEFLHKNRMYEVLGLFVLLIVGVMLLGEGGHLAHLYLFGHAIEPMSTATFYFVIFVLVLVDVVQTRYQSTLLATKEATTATSPE
jgi:predicted tellurium resistance membrane protein TerC